MELGCNWRIGSDRVEALWAQWVGGHSKVWTWGDSVTDQGVTVNRPAQSDRCQQVLGAFMWTLNGTGPLVLWESWFCFHGVAVAPTGHLFNLRSQDHSFLSPTAHSRVSTMMKTVLSIMTIPKLELKANYWFQSVQRWIQRKQIWIQI